MQFWNQFLTLVCLTPAVLAARTIKNEGLVLKVTGPSNTNIEDVYAIAVAKYRPNQSWATQKTAQGKRLPATSFGADQGYSVNIALASQGNAVFSLFVDTGSPLTWILGTGMNTSAAQDVSHYNTSRSHRVPGKSATMLYTGGSQVSGDIYRDTLLPVGGGGGGDTSALVEIAAIRNGSGLEALPTSGLMGLDIIPTPGNPGPFQVPRIHAELKKAGLSNGVFAVDFNADPDGTPDAAGDLVFAPKVDKYGPVTWIPVWDAQTQWFVSSYQVRVGNKTIQRPWQTTTSAVQNGSISSAGRDPPCTLFDTGSTLNLVDDATLLAIVSELPEAAQTPDGRYFVPCKKPSNAPDTIWWEFGGQWFPLHYKIGSLLWYDRGDIYCALSIQGRGIGNDCDTMGGFFFHGVYTVFDDNNKRIGLSIKH